jgi:hypothetical protein
MDTMRAPGATEASAATAAGASRMIRELSKGGMMTVSAVCKASGPCSTVIEKSALVRTGRPSAVQVKTS